MILLLSDKIIIMRNIKESSLIYTHYKKKGIFWYIFHIGSVQNPFERFLKDLSLQFLRNHRKK